MSNINPPAISSWELSDLQSAVNSTLDQTCAIKRATNGTDASGYTTQTWNTITTPTVAARMSVPTGSYLQLLAERMGDQKTWLVTLPYGTDVKANDQLVINAQTLVVQTVFTPQSYAAAVRVFASEIV